MAWLLLIPLIILAAGFAVTRVLVVLAERRFPPLGQRKEVNGLLIHVLEQGQGRPVVFLHGAFGTLNDFAETIFPQAAASYHSIAVDRPGHGYSDRPATAATPLAQAQLIHQALRQMNVHRPLMVGFSWGGAVALAYGLAFPEDTAALVTLNAVASPWSTPVAALYSLPEVPWLGPLFVHTLVMPVGWLAAGASIRRAFHPLSIPRAFRKAPTALTLRPSNFTANAQDIRALKPALAAQAQHYHELRVPLVIVTSAEDFIVGSNLHSVGLHHAVAGSELRSLSPAGHQILYTHPQEVLEAVRRACQLADVTAATVNPPAARAEG